MRWSTTRLPRASDRADACNAEDLWRKTTPVPRFAYVFMIVRRKTADGSGLRYRGFLYNMLLARAMLGDTPHDFVVLQIGELEPDDERMLRDAGFKLRRFAAPPADAALSYASICISKIYALSLTEYDKVMYMDADIIPERNLDHIFDWPVDVAFTAGHTEPVQGGWFLARPSRAAFDALLELAAWRLSNATQRAAFRITSATPRPAFYAVHAAGARRVAWTNKFGQPGEGWGAWAMDDRGLWLLRYFFMAFEGVALQVRENVPSLLRVDATAARATAADDNTTRVASRALVPLTDALMMDASFSGGGGGGQWPAAWRGTVCRNRALSEPAAHLHIDKFHFAGVTKPWTVARPRSITQHFWHRMFNELARRSRAPLLANLTASRLGAMLG